MRTETVVHRFFINEARPGRIVSFNADGELVTRRPVNAMLHLRKVLAASQFGAHLLNGARGVNLKPDVKLGPIMTVKDWNLAMASAVSEEVEATRGERSSLVAIHQNPDVVRQENEQCGIESTRLLTFKGWVEHMPAVAPQAAVTSTFLSW
ncbi:MAG: hypothetical protein WDN30_13785 [Pararobbsia sp.]